MSSLVLLLGLSLIVVNGVSNGQLQEMWSFVYDTTGGSTTAGQQSNMLLLAGEFVFVFIIATFSEKSNEFSKFAIVLFIALWFVWTMENPQALSVIANALSGKPYSGNSINPAPQVKFALPSPNIARKFSVPTTKFVVPGVKTP